MGVESFLVSHMTDERKEKIKSSFLYKNYIKVRNTMHIQYEFSPEYQMAQRLIEGAKNMVDLGCGTNPHPHASWAVDKYIEPLHREFGGNKTIDIGGIEAQGIKFVEADFENLPFIDKAFDVAYSHHVVEHLDNPEKGLCEMQRVAKSGIIMCPSIFAEYMFSRKYHKWEITARGNTLVFIEKDWEHLWWGEGPHIEKGKNVIAPDGNPFDILLNDGNWYKGIHRYKRLTNMMKKYWYGHHKNMETCFVWKDRFDYLIIYKDGSFISSNVSQ